MHRKVRLRYKQSCPEQLRLAGFEVIMPGRFWGDHRGLTPDKLLDLYRLALDEYRFEVRLGWDRTTYFLALNSAVLGVATGLLKLDNPPGVYLFIALLFLLGVGTSTIGSISIMRNHEYYRRTIVKKTLFENRLGLTDAIADMNPSLNFSIGTTPGQGGYLRILEDPDKYVLGKLKSHSITFWLRSIFIALAFVDLIGAASSISMMICGSHSGHLTSFRSLFKP